MRATKKALRGATWAPILFLLCACSGGRDPGGVEAGDAGRADLPGAPDAGDATAPDAAGDLDLPDARLPGPVVLVAGGTRLVVGGSALLQLLRGDRLLLRIPADALQLGVVPKLDPELNYDPYYFEPGVPLRKLYKAPVGLVWSRPEAVVILETDDAHVVAELTYDDGRKARLEILAPAADRFQIRWLPPAEGSPAAYFRLLLLADATEGFYGLGEVFDRVEHRGTVRAMQFEAAPTESGNNEAHVPVPLLIGTRGWGIFVASLRPGVFAVATEADDLVRITFGLGPAAPKGLDFHLMAAAHPLDITRAYYEIAGFPGPVAPWALGPWIWRDEVAGQAAVEADLQTIRHLDLATTGYWIDRPYASDVNSFDFRPDTYPQPSAMMAKAADLGFEVALWHAPYVDPEGEATAPLYAHALDQGFFPPVRSTALAPWGPPLDFTNPGAVAWWKAKLQAYIDMGVRGFKLDYGEEIIAGAFGRRTPWAFFDGSDERVTHRRYPILYHRTYREVLPEEGAFLLCRAGAWGDQVHGLIIWPGDIDANTARPGEEVTGPDGKSYVAVGGLPAAVVAGSSLGPSGFPLFASDTGGYRHAPPDRETYIRWFEHTALSPAMQVGTNSNDLPWSFGPQGILDPEMLDLYRRYARLHLRLFPYLWTYLRAISDDGRPIQRPLGLAHPELGLHPSDVYLLGDHLLVAPVLRHGVTTKEVPLPAGAWVDWWTGETLQGGQTRSILAPLDRIPLLLRAGIPLPLLRPTIDTLSAVKNPGDPAGPDSFATAAGPLHVRMAPGPAGSFVLYDGTRLDQAPIQGGFALWWSPGSVFGGAVVFEVIAAGPRPSSVRFDDGAPLGEAQDPSGLRALSSGWAYESERGGTIHVKLPAGGQRVEVQRSDP